MIRHYNKCDNCKGLQVIILALAENLQPNKATHSIVCVQCGQETQIKLTVIETIKS